jgi:hypothetical protein
VSAATTRRSAPAAAGAPLPNPAEIQDGRALAA